jgi:hypothetical protein
MLDLFNKVLGAPSNNMRDLLSKQVQKNLRPPTTKQVHHLILYNCLSALMYLSHIILAHSLINKQVTNCKVLSDEFLHMFTHHIDELYSTRDCDVKLRDLTIETTITNISIVSFIQQTKLTAC